MLMITLAGDFVVAMWGNQSIFAHGNRLGALHSYPAVRPQRSVLGEFSA